MCYLCVFVGVSQVMFVIHIYLCACVYVCVCMYVRVCVVFDVELYLYVCVFVVIRLRKENKLRKHKLDHVNLIHTAIANRIAELVAHFWS